MRAAGEARRWETNGAHEVEQRECKAPNRREGRWESIKDKVVGGEGGVKDQGVKRQICCAAGHTRLTVTQVTAVVVLDLNQHTKLNHGQSRPHDAESEARTRTIDSMLC